MGFLKQVHGSGREVSLRELKDWWHKRIIKYRKDPSITVFG